MHQPVVNLSGGNQQKVVLSQVAVRRPELLILDEPTRGIDVGAKFEIYTLIAQLADEGKCILMISSEMPELLGMCDRIYVMNEGRFVAEFDGRRGLAGKDHARHREGRERIEHGRSRRQHARRHAGTPGRAAARPAS